MHERSISAVKAIIEVHVLKQCGSLLMTALGFSTGSMAEILPATSVPR